MQPDVTQIPVPPAARALSTLSHVDYADAFLVDAGPARDELPERSCARRWSAPRPPRATGSCRDGRRSG